MISVSVHFVLTPLCVKYIFCFSINCYGPVSSSPKTSSLVFGAARAPTAVGAALDIQTREKCSLWAHVHPELLPGLPYRRMQWRRSRSTGHVLILLFSTGFPLRSVEKETSLQKAIEMLSGVSSLAAGGVEGSSTVNLGHSGPDKTMFWGRDIHGCVGCESQIVPEECYSQVIKC